MVRSGCGFTGGIPFHLGTNTLFHDTTAPSRPPKNLRGYATSSTSAQVFWTPPDEEYRNGPISEYHIDIMELNTNSLYGTFIVSDSQLGVTALHPYYNYSFAVAAHTNAKGPASNGLVILTFQDGMFFKFHSMQYECMPHV